MSSKWWNIQKVLKIKEKEVKAAEKKQKDQLKNEMNTADSRARVPGLWL